MWSLVWWPHAIAHDLNPFLTKIIWAPSGFNLTWSTTITLASLLFAPLTLTIGPVATYNVLCLMSLPIDALCAFILCWHITRDYSASLLGGYIFGFSPFMLGQLTSGHLHLLLAFSVPLSLYLVLLRTDEQISRLNFILLLASILFAQLLLSLEIFATITMFGALGLLLSWSFSSDQYRETILDLVAPIACAYCVATRSGRPVLLLFLYLQRAPRAGFNRGIFLCRSFEPPGSHTKHRTWPVCIVQLGFRGVYRRMDGRSRRLYKSAAVADCRGLRVSPLARARGQAPWVRSCRRYPAFTGPDTEYKPAGFSIPNCVTLVDFGQVTAVEKRLSRPLHHVHIPVTGNHLSMLSRTRPLDRIGKSNPNGRVNHIWPSEYFGRLLAKAFGYASFLQGRHISALPVEGGECPDSAVFVYGEQYALAGANEDVFRYGRRYHCASSQRLSTMAYFPKPDQASIRSRCRRTVQGVCGGAPCHRNNRH